MKKALFTALAACLLLVPALQSSAQYGDEGTPKIAIKLGVYSPFGTKFRDNIKSLWRNMGLEYTLGSDELDRPLLIASGLATSSDSDLVEASMTGLQCEKRWYANKEEGSSLYYGAGLGYYMLKARDRDFLWMEWENRSGGKLGVTAAVGYQYKESAFGEVRMNYSGALSNGLDFSGITVNLGMRAAF